MEDFVTFEIAKKLKEKGFNWICSHYYRTNDKNLFMIFPSEDWSYIEDRINAPTISQVFKWLREERDIDIVVVPIDGNTVFMSGERYMVSIYNMRKRDNKIHRENKDKYVSWEEAALGGIQYVLDNNAKNWKL